MVLANTAAVSVRSRRVSTKRAAGAPSITAWSKLSVSGSIGLATMRPSRTTGRSTMPPTVATSVSGDRDGPSPTPGEHPQRGDAHGRPEPSRDPGSGVGKPHGPSAEGPGQARATCAATPRRAGAWSGACLARRSSPEIAAHDFWSASGSSPRPVRRPRWCAVPPSRRRRPGRKTARGCRPGGLHLRMQGNRPRHRGDHEAGPRHWRLRFGQPRARLPDIELLHQPVHREPPGYPGQGVQHHLAAARHWPDHITRGAVTAGWGCGG
jgi:hypothetical protein